jgi:hypothetical protein
VSAAPWIIGGAVVLGGGFAFWAWHKEQTAAAAKTAAAAPKHGGGFSLAGAAGKIGALGGEVTSVIAGVPGAGGAFASAGRTILSSNVRDLQSTGRGVLSIAHGNVIGGTKQVVGAAVDTAYTNTGAKQIVSTVAKPVTSVAHAIASLF